MLSIGIVVGLLGYSLIFYGDQLWNGCTQNSLLNIMWPGGQKFIPCKPSSSGTQTTAQADAAAGATTPAQVKARTTAATSPGSPHR